MNTVLLPVKDFKDSKQRLLPALDATARAGLARAMLKDVLTAISASRAPGRVVVFTAADEVMQMARPFGFDVILEKSVDGHSAAVNQMVEELSATPSIGNRFRITRRFRPDHVDPVARLDGNQWSGIYCPSTNRDGIWPRQFPAAYFESCCSGPSFRCDEPSRDRVRP